MSNQNIRLDASVPAGLCVAMYKGTRPGLRGLYNRGVRRVDRGPYSHTELIFTSGISAGASYMDGGFRRKQIEYSVAGNWDFLPIPDPTGELELSALIWANENDGKGYDLWGNVRFVFGLVREDADKVFCSEAVMAMLGFKETWRYGPNGMAPLLETMFKTTKKEIQPWL